MKPSKPKLLLSLLSLMIGLSGTIASGQSQPLKWKLKKDDQFEVRLVQSSNAKTNVDSRETETENSTTIVIVWKVIDVAENGDATIAQSLKSIKLSVGNPAVPSQAIAYDTSSPQDEISKASKKLMTQVMPLLGLRFNVVMSPLGEIKSVSLPTETQDVINQLPATMQLRALFSDQGQKDILGASVVALPSVGLSVGENWTETDLAVTEFGNFIRKRIYTYVGNKQVDGLDFAEFKMDAGMEPTGNEGETQAQGASLKGSLITYSGTGTLMFDLAGGYFSSSKIENRVETERPYREKTIKSEVTNQIEMTVQKL